MRNGRFNISDRYTGNNNMCASAPASKMDVNVLARQTIEPCAREAACCSFRAGHASPRGTVSAQYAVNSNELCSSKNPRLRRAYRTYTPQVNNNGAPRG